MEAAAPVTPAITDGSENTIAPPLEDAPIEERSHMHPLDEEIDTSPVEYDVVPLTEPLTEPVADLVPEPLPIATSGDLNLMPPSTGLPVASSSLSQAFSSIPHAPENDIQPEPTSDHAATEAPIHG
ncbi:MAG: hypothetical protein ABI158_11125, partial [Edaphobacter sp.]